MQLVSILWVSTALVFGAEKDHTAKTEGAKMQMTDREFVESAARSGVTEVVVARQAAQKATREDVREFARQLAGDHQKANDQLADLARRHGIQLPASIEMDNETKQMLNRNGAEFDRAFLTRQIQRHEKDIAHFSYAAEHAQDAAIRDFASKTLPVLKQHLERAKGLQGNVS